MKHLWILILAAPFAFAQQPVLVDTGTGTLQGFVAASSSGVRTFRNIPFAAPPTGGNRWRAPQPVTPWAEPRDATSWGPVCPQQQATDRVIGDEDCLQLNVWTPDTTGPKRPVLVWIHGGGHVQGGAPFEQAGTRIYDGERLAAKSGIVVVTINYRLGPLGYLALPAFNDPDTGASSGNLGTLDQIAALQWVQQNITAFGGDPARVMIAGESAGGVSVCSLIASPQAAGLFHSAAIQSGGCVARTRESAESFGDKFTQAAGCADAPDVAACLFDKPAGELVSALDTGFNIATESGDYNSVIDGVVQPRAPLDSIRRNEHNPVPVIIGNNDDETSRSVPPIATEAEYEALVRRTFPAIGNLVLQTYPASAYSSPRAAFAAVTSDSRFICPSTYAVATLRDAQSEPVYRYHFDFVPESANALLRPLGTWHGLDVLYLFESLNGIAGYRPSPADLAVASEFAHYWTSLAAGMPLEPDWPASGAGDPYLLLNAKPSIQQGVRAAQCEFWLSLIDRNP